MSKRLLVDAPVLAFPDISLEFILETDASRFGLEAVLEQTHADGTTHPIAYASHTVQPCSDHITFFLFIYVLPDCILLLYYFL